MTAGPSTRTDVPDYVFVVPSLALSGGVQEIVRLAGELAARGRAVRIVALWSAPAPVDTGGVPATVLSAAGFSRARAAIDAPALLLGFRRWLALIGGAPRVVLSHYATYTLAPAVPRARRWFLVQDLEWRFAPAGPYRAGVERFVLAVLRRGRVVVANAYLSDALAAAGVPVAAQVDVWAAPAFAAARDGARDVDAVLVLRSGAHKRADLARAVIAQAAARHPGWRIAAITPDPALAAPVADRLASLLVAPDVAAMRALHARSRLHLLLSDHEGFGLPPLEAMGAGCVPLCRDAGGVRAYLRGPLAGNLIPPEAGVEAIVDRAAALLGDRQRWRALSRAAAEMFDRGQAAQARRLDAPAAAAFVDDEGAA